MFVDQKQESVSSININTSLLFQPIRESSISLTEPEFRFNFELQITILLFIKCQYQIINTSLLFQPIRELNISWTEPDLIVNYNPSLQARHFSSQDLFPPVQASAQRAHSPVGVHGRTSDGSFRTSQSSRTVAGDQSESDRIR